MSTQRNVELTSSKRVWERKYILLTLSHAEKRTEICAEVISGRILNCFPDLLRSLVISQEVHETSGYHFHVGILSVGISKFVFTKKLRSFFPEFEGSQFFVKFHKGWGTICNYITKEDGSPFVWGEYTSLQIKEISEAARKHKKSSEVDRSILDDLGKCENWYDIYDDAFLSNCALRNYSGMRSVFEDLQTVKSMKSSVFERIVCYLFRQCPPGSILFPREYSLEELQEKYLVLDWLACQLCWQRPIKTKQLFIYGEPSTQKTLLFQFLSNALKIYFASSRRNDFTGAHDYYDLWLFDEFHEPEANCSSSVVFSSSMEGSSFSNTLLRMLDGQECRLDSKYGRIFSKKHNVPIVMISNSLSHCLTHEGSFQERFMRIRFTSCIENLEESRVIATLYGCMTRRISRCLSMGDLSSSFFGNITYNKCFVSSFSSSFSSSDSSSFFSLSQSLVSLSGESFFTTPPGDEKYSIRDDYESDTPHLNFLIDDSSLDAPNLSLFGYLIIPLSKPFFGAFRDEEKSFPLFNKGYCFINRFADEDKMDYATWPASLVCKDSKGKRSCYLLKPGLLYSPCELIAGKCRLPISSSAPVGTIYLGVFSLKSRALYWCLND